MSLWSCFAKKKNSFLGKNFKDLMEFHKVGGRLVSGREKARRGEGCLGKR